MCNRKHGFYIIIMLSLNPRMLNICEIFMYTDHFNQMHSLHVMVAVVPKKSCLVDGYGPSRPTADLFHVAATPFEELWNPQPASLTTTNIPEVIKGGILLTDRKIDWIWIIASMDQSAESGLTTRHRRSNRDHRKANPR